MTVFLTRLLQPFVFVGRFVWSQSLSTTSLLEFSRAVRFFLTSGMTLREAMRTLGERGTLGVKSVSRKIGKDLAAGWTFHAAMERQGRTFPTLFVALTEVGEETGRLPEVFKDLENYYELRRQQQSQLRSQMLLPVMQFFAAVGIVALLIFITGELPPVIVNNKPKAADPLQWGLIGREGAIQFLAYVFGGLAAIILFFWGLRSLLRKRAIVDRILLYVPVVGPCLRNIALTRFSFAMQLMLDSSMSILKIIRLSFSSTDNQAFGSVGPKAEANVKRGNSIVTGLAEVRLFPKAYLSSAAIGEETGHLPEVMRQLTEYHDERAKKGITFINRIIGTGVWLFVAAFVTYMIFRIFSMYIGILQKNMPG